MSLTVSPRGAVGAPLPAEHIAERLRPARLPTLQNALPLNFPGKKDVESVCSSLVGSRIVVPFPMSQKEGPLVSPRTPQRPPSSLVLERARSTQGQTVGLGPVGDTFLRVELR